jgi:NitT/TauT family transport system substrate-binding protein
MFNKKTSKTAAVNSLASSLLAAAGVSLLLASGLAQAADKVRLAMPTQSWWPTTVVTAADKLGFFKKEGIDAEITVYAGGGPAFEALAAKAADITVNPVYLVALGRGKNINSKVVASGSTVYSGWNLLVPKNSAIKSVGDLAGKKVGITATGSLSDFLSLWAADKNKVAFTRVPVGGGGLTPNLMTGNIDAAVVYSPVSFQLLNNGSNRTLLDFGEAVDRDLNAGWIATDSLINTKPKAVQGTLNAIYGAVQYMQKNKDYSIKLIAELNDLSPEVATLEYERSIMKASPDGVIDPKAVDNSIAIGVLGGLKNLAPAADTYVTSFRPVPTQK